MLCVCYVEKRRTRTALLDSTANMLASPAEACSLSLFPLRAFRERVKAKDAGQRRCASVRERKRKRAGKGGRRRKTQANDLSDWIVCLSLSHSLLPFSVLHVMHQALQARRNVLR